MANEENLAPPFQPGVSGNPAGRPKGSKSAKTRALEMLKVLADDGEPMSPIFKLINDILTSDKEQTKDRLKAADMLLDRIEGKATMKVEDVTALATPIGVKIPVFDGSKPSS